MSTVAEVTHAPCVASVAQVANAYTSWTLPGHFLDTSCVAQVANAYIADVSAPSEVPKRMAILSAVAGLAYVVGPALGSALSVVGISFPFFAGTTPGPHLVHSHAVPC